MGRKIGVRVHHQERKKVYDFESQVLREEEWGRWRMTVAWSTIFKRKIIYVDERNGKKGCHLALGWGTPSSEEFWKASTKVRRNGEGGVLVHEKPRIQEVYQMFDGGCANQKCTKFLSSQVSTFWQ